MLFQERITGIRLAAYGQLELRPGPLEMMAVAKSWYERFGAVPAAVSSGEVNFIGHPSGPGTYQSGIRGTGL